MHTRKSIVIVMRCMIDNFRLNHEKKRKKLHMRLPTKHTRLCIWLNVYRFEKRKTRRYIERICVCLNFHIVCVCRDIRCAHIHEMRNDKTNLILTNIFWFCAARIRIVSGLTMPFSLIGNALAEYWRKFEFSTNFTMSHTIQKKNNQGRLKLPLTDRWQKIHFRQSQFYIYSDPTGS